MSVLTTRRWLSGQADADEVMTSVQEANASARRAYKDGDEKADFAVQIVMNAGWAAAARNAVAAHSDLNIAIARAQSIDRANCNHHAWPASNL